MKYPSVRLVFDRKHVATKEKAGLIQIEVMYLRKRKYISSGIKVYADQWHPKKMIFNRASALEENLRLKAQVDSIQEYITDLIRANEPFSFEGMEAHIQKTPRQQGFLQFIEKRIDERGDVRESTKKTHESLLNVLYDFGKIKTMADITKANVTLFDDWLHARGYKQTTVYGYHKRLKRYINEAIKFDLIETNPYAKVKIARGKAEGVRYLLMEELQFIELKKMPSVKMERVRDLFIFQAYTGLAYSDLAKFDWADVKQDGDDYIIEDCRCKTDERYFIVLLKPALRVLRKYDFQLPKISNQKYNDYIKLVMAACGIDKPVTSHWARHSYAVMMLSLGARMQNVSKMLGHSSMAITEAVYAKVLARDLKRDFDRINGLID